jgi:NAD+ diphosphatase
MRLGLPDSYPSACALPFNHESLKQDFQLSTPDQDPHTEGVWLLLNGTKITTAGAPHKPELPSGALSLEKLSSQPVHIGNWQGRPCRMAFITDDYDGLKNYQQHSVHAKNPQIPISLLSLAGVGLMINHWEQSSRYCGYCGQELQRLPGQWGKYCGSCGNHHFPRIHPCSIGLVIKGDEILLVRKPEWLDGRYGLVAGFVEFGESLEEAMAREIKEETGIDVDNVRYLGSQCWPFPSQIMNGFVADYVSGDIVLQDDELEAAAWFKLEALPNLPPQRSIARYLIDRAAEFLQR